jgi:hypothetical protein
VFSIPTEHRTNAAREGLQKNTNKTSVCLAGWPHTRNYALAKAGKALYAAETERSLREYWPS